LTAPVRLQLSRRKGFGLQAHSLATNGLPAVNVARPGAYGNPFVIGERPRGEFALLCAKPVRDADHAVTLFRRALAREVQKPGWIGDQSLDALVKLRGKNLACWCKPGEPCHADVLLELANRPVCEEA
jgi:hypothetical protein